MANIEIRDYQGDFEDYAELARQVWITEYLGRLWFPILDAAFLRWKLSAESGAICLGAYDGTRLVGNVCSVPHLLRVGGSVYPVAFYTGFTVTPDHRRLALPLIERLRRDNEERGVAFGIGMIFDYAGSASSRFWTKYAETFPQSFRLMFRGGYWAKFLAPDKVVRAGVAAWERLTSRSLGPLLRSIPFGYDPNVRAYRAEDLERCVQMLNKASEGFDWAVIWQSKLLSTQLANSTYQTFVFERDGQVKGMVNGAFFTLHGREPIRAMMIALWADDDLTGTERVRLLSHLCTDLRERGVHVVVAPRCAMMPGAAFMANLFFPATQHYRIGVFLTPRTVPLSPPKTWSLEII